MLVLVSYIQNIPIFLINYCTIIFENISNISWTVLQMLYQKFSFTSVFMSMHYQGHPLDRQTFFFFPKFWVYTVNSVLASVFSFTVTPSLLLC